MRWAISWLLYGIGDFTNRLREWIDAPFGWLYQKAMTASSKVQGDGPDGPWGEVGSDRGG
jgi:hypothetical protein